MCKDAGSRFASLHSAEDLHAKSLHMAWGGGRLDQLPLHKLDSWKAGWIGPSAE